MNWREDLDNLLNSAIEGSNWNDFHSSITIVFGELIESGFDWGFNDYFLTLSTEDRTRLKDKIEARYYYREICVVPPGIFKHFLVRKLNEIMPKYNELYKLVKDGRFDVLRTQVTGDKGRSIFSEYPQSQLQGNSDYATNANDNETISNVDGPVVNMVVQYQQYYNDIDVMILDELNICFLSLISTSVNGF